MSDVSEAFFAAVVAVGKTNGVKPLPKGLNKASVGGWDLTVNVSDEAIDGVPPYSVVAVNLQHHAFVDLDSKGGVMFGYSEGDFIRDMQAARRTTARTDSTS